MQRRPNFNPRTPCGVRLFTISPVTSSVYTFQSTHPVRGATYVTVLNNVRLTVFQSTHPVRGATRRSGCIYRACACISIHAPRAGCDSQYAWDVIMPLSISIHAPRAGCDPHLQQFVKRFCKISIHAPRAGCDPPLSGWGCSYCTFQSTHPVRGATSLTGRLSG